MNSIIILKSNYYKNKMFLPEKTALFCIGQIVSAKSKKYNTWLRARIVKITKYDDINKNKYQVNFKLSYPLKLNCYIS